MNQNTPFHRGPVEPEIYLYTSPVGRRKQLDACKDQDDQLKYGEISPLFNISFSTKAYE